ncbi:MAG: DHH family phosphoesterase [Patescibacteria group bacterium]
MLDQKTVQAIKAKLDGAKKVLLVGHANPRPDADSLGSVLALADYLSGRNQPFTAFSGYPPAESLKFLPGVKLLVSNAEEIKIADYDLIILLDFSELKNSGLAEKLNLAKAAGVGFIIFDHHITQKQPAELALICPTAAATCEVLFNFFRQAGVAITAPMANCLLAGILSDTQNYTNLGTTFSSLGVGASLVAAGGKFSEIIKETWQNKNLAILRLWGLALERLMVDPATGLASTAITLADLKAAGVGPEALDDVSNFLNSVDRVTAVMFLKEEPGGKVKASLRTTRDDVDVAEMARQFGGGGHRKAAGFLISGKIVKTERGWAVEG